MDRSRSLEDRRAPLGTAILIMFGAITFCCVLIRAATFEITYDEAFTYLAYAQHFNVSKIPHLFESSLANNHWLNTVLIHFVQGLTKIYYNEFCIRFPNICAALLLIVTVILAYKKGYIKFLTGGLLILNNCAITWLSQARGNGLALSLVTVGLILYVVWLKGEMKRDIYVILAFFSFAAATYAITPVIFPFAALVIWVGVKLLQKKELARFIKRWFLALALIFVSQLIIFQYSLNISAPGKPIMPNEVSFFDAIFESFVTMYLKGDGVQTTLFAVLPAGILLAAVVLFRKKLRESNFVPVFVLWLLFTLIEKFVFQIDYPIQRLLLCAVPVMLLALEEACTWFYEYLRETRFQKFLNVSKFAAAAVIIVVVSSSVFISQLTVLRQITNPIRAPIYTAAFNGETPELPYATPAAKFYRQQIQHYYGITVKE